MIIKYPNVEYASISLTNIILELEIILVIKQFLPEVSRINYNKNKNYTQELYVETACENLGINYFNLPNYAKNELCKNTHKLILKEYKKMRICENLGINYFNLTEYHKEKLCETTKKFILKEYKKMRSSELKNNKLI